MVVLDSGELKVWKKNPTNSLHACVITFEMHKALNSNEFPVFVIIGFCNCSITIRCLQYHRIVIDSTSVVKAKLTNRSQQEEQ